MKKNALIVFAALIATTMALIFSMRESDNKILERLNKRHSAYIQSEHPERGKLFVSLVDAMSSYVERSGNINEPQIVEWLGNPDAEWDQVDDANHTIGKTALVYFYKINGEDGQAFFAFLNDKTGIIHSITFAKVPRSSNPEKQSNKPP